jgi:RNA polymerase sigma factor (sigma-70 family)
MTMELAAVGRLSQLDDFGAFYKATFSDVYRLVFGILRDPDQAEDVTQEAFLTAYRRRTTYRGEAPASHWMMRIAANQAISAGRRGDRRVGWVPLDATLPDAKQVDPAIAAVNRIIVHQAVGELSARQRAALTLRYVHDLDYRAIGEILGMTTNNVGVTLSRALAAVKQRLVMEQTNGA